MLRMTVTKLQELMSNKDTCIVALADAVAEKDNELRQAQERIQRLERVISSAAAKRPRRIGHCVKVAEAAEAEAR